MDIAAHVSAVQVALADLATDDEASTAAAQRLSAAIGPALQLQLLDLLGEVALEVSRQIPDGHLDLQLAGRDAALVYRADVPEAAPAPPDEGSDTARLTLRMPDSLKTSVEAAAASQNISTNAWLIAAARRHLAPASHAGPNPVSSNRRISGYIQN
jgi:hypothetical protein